MREWRAAAVVVVALVALGGCRLDASLDDVSSQYGADAAVDTAVPDDDTGIDRADTADAPIACGLMGGPCCADGGACIGGLGCNGKTCVPCGRAGQPCCDGACSAGASVTCQAGTCKVCGDVGRGCCAGNTCSNGTACVAGSCEYCCAWCNDRAEYHRVVGVTSACDAAAKAYCQNGHGGLTNVTWAYCPI